MLEDIAIQYVNQSESTLQQLNIGLFVVGAVIGAFVTKSKSELKRAPYFVYLALIFFLVSAVQMVWLQAVPAINGGYLWVLMVISVAVCVASGFLACRIAIARSRDAYGHARMAFLAFIPIANFWLMLVSTKNATSANRTPTISLLSGGFGVLTGFVLIAAGSGVSVYIEAQMGQLERKVQTEPMSQQASMKFLIRSKGLEGTLQIIADESETPVTVDGVTTLSSIDAVGTQLRRTYVVDLQGATMTNEFQQGSRDGICAHQALVTLLRAGATIREVYIERNGREIGAILVGRQECGL